ncbi:Pyruvate dehydrogenase complex repressor, partial [Klebsiella oxytoca]|jgi:DNA-binding GntR family transcriptional regulator
VKKIERKQTRDHITQMIRYEILSGGMKPGEELAQESIAEQLGLSRMPVREALQALEQEGFLVRLPNRHMQVAKLEPDHVSHIFRAIAVMATELFLLVPAAAGESLAARARALAHPGERSRELAFHQTLISYIDNRYLQKIYQQFLDGYISYVILYLKEDNQESAQILSSLMDAIRRGDGDEIAQETQRYFLSLAEIMRQHMKDWESAEASIREN